MVKPLFVIDFFSALELKPQIILRVSFVPLTKIEYFPSLHFCSITYFLRFDIFGKKL